MNSIFDHINHITFVLLVLALFSFIGCTWKPFLVSALSESTGERSHKRWIAFLYAVLTAIVILYAVMFGVAIADNIMWLLGSIILGAMGYATALGFAQKNKSAGADNEAQP